MRAETCRSLGVNVSHIEHVLQVISSLMAFVRSTLVCSQARSPSHYNPGVTRQPQIAIFI